MPIRWGRQRSQSLVSPFSMETIRRDDTQVSAMRLLLRVYLLDDGAVVPPLLSPLILPKRWQHPIIASSSPVWHWNRLDPEEEDSHTVSSKLEVIFSKGGSQKSFHRSVMWWAYLSFSKEEGEPDEIPPLSHAGKSEVGISSGVESCLWFLS